MAVIITVEELRKIDNAPAGDYWFDNTSLIGKIWFELATDADGSFDQMVKFQDFLWENKHDYSLMGKINAYLKAALKRVYLAKATGAEISW